MQTSGFQNEGAYQQFLWDLGSKLFEMRKSRGLTQEVAANLIGIDRVSLGYIEQGKRAPRMATLFKLSELYEVPIAEFFANTEGYGALEKDPTITLTAQQAKGIVKRLNEIINTLDAN